MEKLRLGTRRLLIVAVRFQSAVHRVTQFGVSLADAARCLGVSASCIAKTVARTGGQ